MESSKLDKTEQLFLEHLPIYRDLPQLRKWLEWADASGFLMTVFGDDETVVAAAIVRPISKDQLAKGYDSFVFDENGEVLFVDNCIAPSTDLMRALFACVLQRYGTRLAIAYDNHRDGIRVRYFNKTRTALLNTK